MPDFAIRHNWQTEEVLQLLALPFNDLLFKAITVHRTNFDPNQMQISTLISIKTGNCPEDCKYCAQSGHYATDLDKQKLLEVEKVIEQARKAKEQGSMRFCMGAAWKCPSKKNMPYVLKMVEKVKNLGLETCMTLGSLTLEQTNQLAAAGLDYYNHNLDTSPEYYQQIITTRTYQDRLQTLQYVREAGIKVCCGGILGMGENLQDRANLLIQIANLPIHPQSVPINMLVKIKGTPLAKTENIDSFDFIRTIACARIMLPKSYIRLAAGRENMNEQMQALAFLAGANSVFYGDKLLTTNNVAMNSDLNLFKRLGINTKSVTENISIENQQYDIAQNIVENIDKDRFYKVTN